MGPKRQPVAAKRVRWLSRQEELAWRAIGVVLLRLPWALECQLEQDSDLSFIEYHALARLSEEADRRLRMSELAVLTNASLSRLSYLVKRLEGWGYVRRQSDPTDGRFTMAILTDRGYTKLVASAPGHVAAVRQLVIDEFSPAELAQLRALCERIAARVDASAWTLELT
jgi:DNA-binding MarR family transcriptional regulator